MDDPLDHPDMCEAQLTHIPKLARYQYKEVCNIITSKSDVILQNYSQIVAHGGALNANQQSQFAAIEGQLAWMTRMMGALIGGQIPLLNRQRIVAEGSGEELHDAQLCKRVFQLINFEVPPGSGIEHHRAALGFDVDRLNVWEFTALRVFDIAQQCACCGDGRS